MVISTLAAPPLLLFTIPLTLVDIGSSLLVDTVMLPADLVITPNNSKLSTPRPMLCRYDYKI
ncbi:YceK/YidQ family lipoprotein [Aeromonas sp. BIGb0445]|uniref:YceK/YidQ family lipoprotein n=1 Tax=Aeromonas sp. BIGb0445 TaxID=2940593 RepID=UPI0038571DAD